MDYLHHIELPLTTSLRAATKVSHLFRISRQVTKQEVGRPAPPVRRASGNKYLPSPHSILGVDLPYLDPSLVEPFHAFSLQESELLGREVQHLVHPSGSLGASVLLKLFYPSFTCKNPDYGPSCDPTSPCPRLLCKAGFDTSNSLWIVSYWRREVPTAKRNSPTASLFRPLIAAHNDFTSYCEEHSTAKVLVAFGGPNRRQYARRLSTTTYDLMLNQTTITVSLVITVEPMLIHRVIIHLAHPEHLYRNSTIELSQTYDFGFGLAAALGHIDDFKFGYFEQRARRRIAQGIPFRQFDDNAFGDIMQLLQDEKTSQKINDVDSLPESVLLWLVRETGISEHADSKAMLPCRTFTASCQEGLPGCASESTLQGN